MAVRYSGDVEVRIGRFAALLRWPSGKRVRRFTYRATAPRKPSPADYDRIARQAIHAALGKDGRMPLERGIFGRIVLRRVFQAPCPGDRVS